MTTHSEATTQKQMIVGESGLNSIEVARNGKGETSWKIKVYDQDEHESLQRVLNIDAELRERFPS